MLVAPKVVRAWPYKRYQSVPAAKPFPSEYRLKTAGEFDFVFKKANRSSSRFFTVLVRPNQLGHPRLGLIISKKCAKAAVRRNRLKRLIRESFRHNVEMLDGLDVVVLGKASANHKENSELSGVLKRHWKELERCKRS